MECGLGIFAKEPVPGRVKTRLSPPLSAEQAASLYRVSLRETVTAMAGGPWAATIFYDGRPEFFREAFPSVPLRGQSGSDLGERMANALADLLSVHRRAVLIGSDSPDLPQMRVDEAFAALSDHDVVVAPAGDGGYVLIGACRPHPELFRDIPWSTGRVLEITRRRAHEAGIGWREIEGWEDVDDVSSLNRLIIRSPASATAQLARLLLAPEADSPARQSLLHLHPDRSFGGTRL